MDHARHVWTMHGMYGKCMGFSLSMYGTCMSKLPLCMGRVWRVCKWPGYSGL